MVARRQSKWKAQSFVTTVLKDLDRLNVGSALKVPLAELGQSKEKLRQVATASDATFLCVWNVTE